MFMRLRTFSASRSWQSAPFSSVFSLASKMLLITERIFGNWLCVFDLFAERRSRWFVAILVGISAWSLSIFLYAPRLWKGYARLSDFLAMCANPLERQLSEPILEYRIMTPLVAWMLHLPAWGAIGIQYVALIATFSILYLAMQRRTNRITALLTCFALSLTYVSQFTNIHPGYPDSVTHLCIAVALFCPLSWVFALATIFGTLNDERFVVAIPLILLWHVKDRGLFIELRESLRLAGGFLVGLIVVYIVRHALTVGGGWLGKGIATPEVYHQIVANSVLSLHPFNSTWPNFAVSVFLSFRWVWLVPLFALVRIRQGTARCILGAGCGFVLLTVMSTVVVWDVARSIAFIFPFIVMSAWQLAQRDQLFCNRVLAAVIVLAVLTPSLEFYDRVNRPRPMYPLPLALGITWINEHLWNLDRSSESREKTQAPLQPRTTTAPQPSLDRALRPNHDKWRVGYLDLTTAFREYAKSGQRLFLPQMVTRAEEG